MADESRGPNLVGDNPTPADNRPDIVNGGPATVQDVLAADDRPALLAGPPPLEDEPAAADDRPAPLGGPAPADDGPAAANVHIRPIPEEEEDPWPTERAIDNFLHALKPIMDIIALGSRPVPLPPMSHVVFFVTLVGASCARVRRATFRRIRARLPQILRAAGRLGAVALAGGIIRAMRRNHDDAPPPPPDTTIRPIEDQPDRFDLFNTAPYRAPLPDAEVQVMLLCMYRIWGNGFDDYDRLTAGFPIPFVLGKEEESEDDTETAGMTPPSTQTP